MTFRKINHCLVALTLSAGMLSLPSTSFAVDEYNVSTGLSAELLPLGLHGVDPVRLMTHGDSTKGLAANTVNIDGVSYYFGSEGTKRIFEQDPDKYLPQYGGYCLYGMYKGKKFDGDPRYMEIVDGKVYLFVNQAVIDLFNSNRTGIIKKADKNWKKYRSTAVSKL